jgi:hypothetical protein
MRRVVRHSEDEAESASRAAVSDRGRDLSFAEAGKLNSLISSSAMGTVLCRRNLLNRQFRLTAARLALKDFN